MSIRRVKRGSVGLAVVALVSLGIPGIAGAAANSSTSAKPTVSGFTASPTSLASAGGSVTLSATVTGATSCELSSTKAAPGLPETVSCPSGQVSVPLTLPANTTTKAISYKLTLSATATKTAKADTTVTVAALIPPVVSSFSATPTSLAQTGGSVTLSATVTGTTSCVFSVSPAVSGLPQTVPCTGGSGSVSVTLPANTATKAATYKFALSAVGATTVNATSVTVTVAAKAKTTKPPKPKVISFTANPQTLQADGGYVELTATTTNGGLCTITALTLVYGFPDYTTCITGQATDQVHFVPNLGSTAETYTFTITVKGASGSGTAKSTTTVTVQPAPTSLTISPASSSIVPGGSQTYVVTGKDANGNNLGPDTGARLEISGTGTCDGFTCMANDAGNYTVTASDGLATADATLTVAAIASLAISPASSSIVPGGSQTYIVTGKDANGNNLGPDTAATLTISPDGSCTGMQCTASTMGPHTVTATDGTVTPALTTAGTLNVTGPLTYLMVSPGYNYILLGASQAFTVEAYDASYNDLGPDTAATLSISAGGSCTGDTCTATAYGGYTVTATDGGVTGSTILYVATADCANENYVPYADLEGCDLSYQDISRADLTGANLTGANLLDGGLTDVTLTDANLTGASLLGVQSLGIVGQPAALPANWVVKYGFLFGPGADLADGTTVAGGGNCPDFTGLDLSNLDLQGATICGTLTNTNLSGTDFAGAQLFFAQSGGIIGTPVALPDNYRLIGGYLFGPNAVFYEVDLAGLDLSGVDLDGAQFPGSTLTDLNVSGANLNADFEDVTSSGIIGTPAALEPGDAIANGCILAPYVQLSNVDLSGTHLAGVNLMGADLYQVDLTGADLSGANFGYANSSYLEYQAAALDTVDLTGANLTGDTLDGDYMDSDILTDANVTGVTFTGSQFGYTSSGGLVGEPASLPPTWKLVNGYVVAPYAELSWAALTGADLSGVDMSNADLSSAVLTGADLSGADMSNADLQSADLSGTDLMATDLSDAYAEHNLNLVVSGGITGTPAALPSSYTIVNGYLCGPGVDLTNADLAGASLPGVDLSFAVLAGTDFNGADLSGVNFYYDDLTNTNLSNANLSGANLSPTILTGTNLQGANLSGASYSGASFSNTTCPDGSNSDTNGYWADPPTDTVFVHTYTCIGHGM